MSEDPRIFKALAEHLGVMSRFFKGLNPYWSRTLAELAGEGARAAQADAPARDGFLGRVDAALEGGRGLAALHVSAVPARERFKDQMQRLHVLLNECRRENASRAESR